MSSEKKENQTMIKESQNDWVIEELVNWSNLGSLTIGISILVSGTIISGKLIGVKEYYYLYGKQWIDSVDFTDPESAKNFENRWKTLGDEAERNLKETMEKGGMIEPPHFIHLKEAKVISGSLLVPSNHGMLWRGKISTINGFSLGSLEPG